eukprot:SAG25_NODE_6635_length_542_cov_1.805869_1_plen_38_part_01
MVALSGSGEGGSRPYFSYALTPGFNSITAKFFDRVVLL